MYIFDSGSPIKKIATDWPFTSDCEVDALLKDDPEVKKLTASLMLGIDIDACGIDIPEIGDYLFSFSFIGLSVVIQIEHYTSLISYKIQFS